MLCQKCGKKEGPTPNARFCNNCYHRRFLEKNPDYDKDRKYGGNRKKALERDNFSCRSCGKNENEVSLEIHHIDGNGSRKPVRLRNNKLDNLITLCAVCHRRVEYARRGPTQKGLPSGVWAKNFERCIACGEKGKRHLARGLCSLCYEKTRRDYKRKYWRDNYAIDMV